MPKADVQNPAATPRVGEGFVGREQELDHVGALVSGPARLVTLIGPGGIGKTRLAEEAARRVHRARRTPVFVVRLAGLPKGTSAEAVCEAVTAAVLVEGFVGASAWDGAVERLSSLDAAGRVSNTILVVDNCEHVSAGAGAVITDLLETVPRLTIMATSREPLGWSDEQLVAVPPLSTEQSVELFRQRAELAGHPVAEPAQLAVAEQICGRMHGNPLFIQLAAARMFYEPLPMILGQLSGESDDARMRWRHGPRVGSAERHRGIGDVILWSYELCRDQERLLFDRLSVFAPGYDINPHDAITGVADAGAELEAIEVVCADDVVIPDCEDAPSMAGGDQPGAVGLARADIRELLDRLVEQSLVSVYLTGDTARYFLLESLRLFASDRLAERSSAAVDESARLARRHYYYYRNKILQAQAKWSGPADQQLMTWASGAWSNIQRSIDASMAAGEPIVSLQLAVSLMSLRALLRISSLPEIRGRIEQTLAATEASQRVPTELHVSAIAQLAWLAVIQGRPRDAEELVERCVVASGVDAAHSGHWRDRPETDIGLPAMIDFVWGVELMLSRRDGRAVIAFARAGKKYRSAGHPGSEKPSELFEALATGFYGPAEQAMSVCRRYLERTTAAGAWWECSWAQMALAIALTKHGDANEALQLGRDALAYQLPTGDQWGPTWVVHVRMWSLTRLLTDHLAAGHTRRSTLVELATEIAYLAGGLKTLRSWIGMLIEHMGPFDDETNLAERVARRVLGHDSYTNIEKRGSRLSAETFEVYQVALGTLPIKPSAVERPGTRSASSHWQTLSKAERAIAILAAAGTPNSTIAARRGTSKRTVEAQITSIFYKLTINTREEIIHFVPQDQRDQIAIERAQQNDV